MQTILFNSLLLASALVGVLVEAKAMASDQTKAMALPQDASEFSSKGPFFTINIDIGSNAETMNVGVESYYGATVLYGSRIQCDGTDSYCLQHKTYEPRMSDTFKPDPTNKMHNWDFSLGTATGKAGNDDIFIGMLSKPQAMFGVADTASTNLQRKSRTSGYIAMGSPQMADDMKTTMQFIVEKAANPSVTFYAPSQLNGVHKVSVATEDTTNCPMDSSSWSVFPNVPAIDTVNQPWTIQLSGGFTFGSMSDSTMINAALSTAGDYFVAPKAIAQKIYKQLNAQYSSRFYGGMVSCDLRNSAPDLVFKHDKGADFVIKPSVYIKRFTMSSCLLNIYPDDLNQWTLPYQFHQTRCVKYDYGAKTVSIAPANGM